jgi:hypothetical protein
MKMKNKEKIIGKIAKMYELDIKANNLRLYNKGDIVFHEHTFIIFKSIV